MDNELICPECKSKILEEWDKCQNCGFPLKGNEKNDVIIYEKGKESAFKQICSNSIKSMERKVSVLIKAMAVLMLIVAINNISYIFTFFNEALRDIFDYQYFGLYTFAYLIVAIEYALIVVGFSATALILLTNKKKECLNIFIFVIASSYFFKSIENLLFLIDWFYFYNLIILLLSIAITILWCCLASKNSSHIFWQKSQKKVFVCVIAIVCFVNFVCTVNGAYYFDNLSLFMSVLEYCILALFIWCGVQEIWALPLTEEDTEREKMETSYTNNNFNNLNMNLESINGYVKIGHLILFSILTLGIYTYIWIYRTVGLFNEKRIGEERSQGLQVVLCLFVPFYMIYWLYKQSKLTEEYTIKVGNRSNDLSVISLLLSLFGLSIIAVALIQDQINKNLITERGYMDDIRVNVEIKRNDTETKESEDNKVIIQTVKDDVDRISDIDIEYLKKLKELYDMGILSEAEFNTKKEKILKR